MRISKHGAGKLAEVLLAQRSKALQDRKTALQEIINKEYIESVPKDVLQCFEKNRSWFRSDPIIYWGVNHSLIFTGYGPADPSGRVPCYRVDAKHDAECAWVLSESNAIHKLKKKIEAILLSLGTKARVIEQFPELEPYFPKPTSGNGSLVPAAIEQLKAEIAG